MLFTKRPDAPVSFGFCRSLVCTGRLKQPSYYDHGFSEEELGVIHELTRSTYEQLLAGV